jgi:hypothetical protein
MQRTFRDSLLAEAGYTSAVFATRAMDTSPYYASAAATTQQ